jgi:hypothetical protein
MTTLCVKDGQVAADTQLTGQGRTVRIQKLFRLPDGGVAAAAGVWSAAYPFLKWLTEGEKGDPPAFEDALVVIVRPDKSIWIADCTWPAYPLLDKTYAVGSGSDLAQYAMSKGATPGEAVKAAVAIDLFTNARIQTMSVVKRPKLPKAAPHKKAK